MKSTITAILLALASTVVLTSLAEDPTPANPYEIKNILRANKTIAWVDNGWKSNASGISAELHISRPLQTDKFYARAYFYDRESKLLDSFKKPVESSEDHRNYSSLPAVLKPHQASKVWFPIGEKSAQPTNQWARVVIVFGDENHATAESYPKDDLGKFDFPEKDLVSKNASGPGSPK